MHEDGRTPPQIISAEARREQQLADTGQFIDELLIPSIKDGLPLTQESLGEMENRFRQIKGSPILSFEMEHVEGRLFKTALAAKFLRRIGQNVSPDLAASEQAWKALRHIRVEKINHGDGRSN